MSDHCDSVPTVVEETVVVPDPAPAVEVEEVAPAAPVVEEVAPVAPVVEEVAPAPAVEVEEVAPSS